jgi:hypothetical protein
VHFDAQNVEQVPEVVRRGSREGPLDGRT